MTTDRELLKQALEALVWCQRRYEGFGPEFIPLTIAALRERLAQPEQEPVAWMVYALDGTSVCGTDNPADFTPEHRVLPLYTTPPRREWVGLTEDEIAEITREAARGAATRRDGTTSQRIARAIEAKLREKNG